MAAELTTAQGNLTKANGEAAERRKELKKYKDAETERERTELSEAEKLKLEVGDWKTKYETEANEHGTLKAKYEFKDAGASDVDSVLLHWNALPAEEREKTTPAAYAKVLAKAKPHLFGTPEKPTDTGGDPNDDGGRGGGGKPKLPTNPQSAADLKLLKDKWKSMSRR